LSNKGEKKALVGKAYGPVIVATNGHAGGGGGGGGGGHRNGRKYISLVSNSKK